MDKLEFDQLMATAIKREMEANAFYGDVARKVENEDVKKVFAELASEEMGHAELLERYKADPTMVMKINPPDLDTKVAEATDLPELSVNMKPADAVALAMKKEQQAVEFYRGLADGTDDAEVKDILTNLSNMELAHKSRLENIFAQIGYPEDF